MRPSTCAACARAIDPDRDELFGVDEHAIVRCPGCGLVRRAVFPEPDGLEALHADDCFAAAEGSLGVEGYVDHVVADLAASEPESRITMWNYLEHSIDPRGESRQPSRAFGPAGSSRSRRAMPARSSRLGAVAIPVDLWDVMTVAARRALVTSG